MGWIQTLEAPTAKLKEDLGALKMEPWVASGQRRDLTRGLRGKVIILSLFKLGALVSKLEVTDSGLGL